MLDVLQHWLEIGLVRTPVALRGTGFFEALKVYEASKAPLPAAAAPIIKAAQLYLDSDSRTCAVCESTCAIAFNDDVNAWVFTDATKINSSKVVHYDCAEDGEIVA